MTYTIRKGVKMPNDPDKYPFFHMDVGDSFLFGPEEEAEVKSAVREYIKDHKARFTFRQSKNKMGCWRVE